MFHFGSGTLWGYPVAGNLAANPTPIKFGTLQDVNLEISAALKELYGQNQFAEAVARGKCKITGKAKVAQIVGKHVNDLFFGQTMNSGQKLTALDEAQSVPGGSPARKSISMIICTTPAGRKIGSNRVWEHSTTGINPN